VLSRCGLFKLEPELVQNKIHTCVKFKVSIFNETKVTKIIVKYTYDPTDRKLDILYLVQNFKNPRRLGQDRGEHLVLA
jgi:hypothetical protein